MSAKNTMENTKVRISDTITINDQEVMVAETMAIGPIAPGFAGVTLTIFTEDFDVDWKKVPSNVAIIAPDEVIADRAAEIANFKGDYIHGCVVDENTIRASMTLRIDKRVSTPVTFIKAIEHMISKGVPPDSELLVHDDGEQIRIESIWLQKTNDDQETPND